MASTQQTPLERVRAEHSRELEGIGYRSHAALEADIARLTNVYNTILRDENICQYLEEEEEEEEIEQSKEELRQLALDNKYSKRTIRDHQQFCRLLAPFRHCYAPGHAMRTGEDCVDQITETDSSIGQRLYRRGIEVIVRYKEMKVITDKVQNLIQQIRAQIISTHS